VNIRGRVGVLHKLVFEVRYRFGFTYLDRCGRAINRIMRDAPEWILAGGGISPQNAPLVSLQNTAQLNFSAHKYDLGLEQAVGAEALEEKHITRLREQVDLVARIIHEELALKEFTRVGFRMWYIFGSDSKEDSERWVRDLGFFTTSGSLTDAFEGSLAAQNHTAVVEGDERSYRISVNGVERQAQVDLGSSILSVRSSALSKGQRSHLREQLKANKRIRANPEFAVMIDVDAFLEDPVDIDPKHFIVSSAEEIQKRLPKAFSA